jgi:hypothetical protein
MVYTATSGNYNCKGRNNKGSRQEYGISTGVGMSELKPGARGEREVARGGMGGGMRRQVTWRERGRPPHLCHTYALFATFGHIYRGGSHLIVTACDGHR